MKCECGVEKITVIDCAGPFCEPDSFAALRIAQNFKRQELQHRLSKIEADLKNDPVNCHLQAAYTQLDMALQFKGGK